MTERETQPTADNKYPVHSIYDPHIHVLYVHVHLQRTPSNVSYNLHSIHSGINIQVHV